ncbi:MAG: family hydrolase [Bacteroidetes bacterium]|nr:family hydrolase [Bacteroidota bacterium]
MGINPKIKAIFLDRDGVLNKALIIEGKPYPPKTKEEVEILDGVPEGLQELKKLGFILIVITNQPDVARGTTSLQFVTEINNFLKQQLIIDDFLCCYHDSVDNCNCRKPKPGMILSASKTWNIDLSKSFLIGDRWRDIDAGINAGVKTILIDYGYNEKRSMPNYSCSKFIEAVQFIKSHDQL